MPQRLQSHVGGRLTAQEAAKRGEKSTGCQALSSASKLPVEQPTGGSVMTLSTDDTPCLLLAEKEKGGAEGDQEGMKKPFLTFTF